MPSFLREAKLLSARVATNSSFRFPNFSQRSLQPEEDGGAAIDEEERDNHAQEGDDQEEKDNYYTSSSSAEEDEEEEFDQEDLDQLKRASFKTLETNASTNSSINSSSNVITPSSVSSSVKSTSSSTTAQQNSSTVQSSSPSTRLPPLHPPYPQQFSSMPPRRGSDMSNHSAESAKLVVSSMMESFSSLNFNPSETGIVTGGSSHQHIPSLPTIRSRTTSRTMPHSSSRSSSRSSTTSSTTTTNRTKQQASSSPSSNKNNGRERTSPQTPSSSSNSAPSPNTTLITNMDEGTRMKQIMVEIFGLLSECHYSLDTLIPKLKDIILKFLNVERCTIFLHDEMSNELYTMAPEEEGKKEIRFPSHAGIAGSVFTDQAPLFIPDTYADKRFNQDIDRKTGFHTKAMICAPIWSGSKVIGVAQAVNKKEGEFSKLDLRLLEHMVMLASQALINTRLMDENHRMKSIMIEISHAMSVSQDLNVLLPSLNRIVCAHLEVERSSIFLYDSKTNELYLRASEEDDMTGGDNENDTNSPQQKSSEIRFPCNAGIAGHVFSTQKPLIIQDAYADERFNQEVDKKTGFHTKSILCTPIWRSSKDGRRHSNSNGSQVANNNTATTDTTTTTDKNNGDNPDESGELEIVGVAQAVNKKNGKFSGFDLGLLQNMTTQAAHALVSAHLADQHARLKNILIEISQTMSRCQKLDMMLPSLSDIIRRYLQVDRCTIFLHDTKYNELHARVKEDGTTKTIRLRAHAGIAGSVFTSQTALIIPDAYADWRFNQEIDRKTGFKTKSILCAPIWKTNRGRRDSSTNSDGGTNNNNGEEGAVDRTVIGVVQAVNKMEGEFTNFDLKLLENMTTQAAHALVNARLTEEVIQIKNYNECILESVGYGIITVDTEGQIFKVNTAAAEMMHSQDPEELVGLDIAEIFSGENDWILHTIHMVSFSGKTTVLKNAQLQLRGLPSLDVNLTMRPLTDPNANLIGCIIQLEDITREKKIHGTLARHMTQSVAELLFADDSSEHGDDEKKQIATVCFSSIGTFIDLSAKIGRSRTEELLNEYFQIMTDRVFENHGTLGKLVGDSVVANFGSPVASPQDADNCVQCAIEIQRELTRINKERYSRNECPIKIEMGISTGEVENTTIAAGRTNFSTMGGALELSSRLEAACKGYGTEIVLSEFSVMKLKKSYSLRELDRIRIPGSQDPVAIYEVLDHRMESGCMSPDALANYYQGLATYRDLCFAEAAEAFANVLQVCPDDVASQKYLQRCEFFLRKPPPKGWDGVWERKPHRGSGVIASVAAISRKVEDNLMENLSKSRRTRRLTVDNGDDPLSNYSNRPPRRLSTGGESRHSGRRLSDNSETVERFEQSMHW